MAAQSSMSAELISAIGDRSARVGVIGLGYVGLPLAMEFARAGFTVTGIDVDAAKIESIRAGKSYITDISDDDLASLVTSGRLIVRQDYATLSDLDTISICVPTPLSKSRTPDISYILAVTEQIAALRRSGQLLVLESTTYPGTTEEIIAPRLLDNGLVVGRDVFLAFSPERVDPGNRQFMIRNTPKVIGGLTPACLEVATALYATIIEIIVPVSSTAAAEMTKLLENTFRAVNIGLVNEIAIMCDKLGIDVWEIIDAAATKPFGFMRFLPGPGLGGHCIPVDPHYLSWKLRTLNYTARFIELAGEVNANMPGYVVEKVVAALNDDVKAVKGSSILVLGVAYKPNVGDVRESPALDILRLLRERTGDLAYHDPHVPALLIDNWKLLSVELNDTVLESADCVVIVTDHATYDWEWIANRARLIVDTRNALKGVAHSTARVVKL